MKLDLLCRIADRAIEHNEGLRVSFKMSTNGVLLTDRAVRRLAARGVDVSLSIDGDPRLNASQRPGADGRDTSKALDDAIDRLLEWNPCASANCVFTNESAGRLDESVRWIHQRGFAYIQTALDSASPWTPATFRDLQQAYRRLADWYVELTGSGRKFYLSCFDDRIQQWARGPLNRGERCFIGHRQFSIAPSGRLYPCVQFVREDQDETYVIGDVFRGFDRDRRSALALCAEDEKPECGGCALLSRCSSGCACANFQSTGRIDRASPVVCEHERILMPIADQVGNRLWRRRDSNFLHKHYNPAFPALAFAEELIMKEREHVS